MELPSSRASDPKRCALVCNKGEGIGVGGRDDFAHINALCLLEGRAWAPRGSTAGAGRGTGGDGRSPVKVGSR